MDKIIEGATALILGFVGTLFAMHVLASVEREGWGGGNEPANEPEVRVLH